MAILPAMSDIDTDVAPAPRLVSVDVFRGMTILLMILVNNPGGLGHRLRGVAGLRDYVDRRLVG